MIQQEIAALADYLRHRQEALLLAWRSAIKKDPDLTSGDSLPRSELYDHIPALLVTFERGLRRAASADAVQAEEEAAQDAAAAHGLQRWKQGYDCREVTREWGKLNECVILELDRYAKANPEVSQDAMTRARQVWTSLCTTGIETSVHEYFALQEQEAAGHVKDLENALEEIRAVERQRADLWQQAAHDLRGNLGVVANVTVGLTRHGKQDSSREDFVRILMRNVTSLHHLLDDVTSLARLQAGRESRQIEPLDVTSILEPLCEGIRPLAAQRGLYLNCEGPAGLAADGDVVKIRRIAQNLVLNAVKYTQVGGVTVTWSDSGPEDPKRWALCIKDTGPGFPSDSAQPIAALLDKTSEPLSSSDARTPAQRDLASALGSLSVGGAATRSRGESGEGIGLSIVKRLCEMLDATIDMQSVPSTGTSFRILFPRRYAR
jgi:signal transduction histidine kinase